MREIKFRQRMKPNCVEDGNHFHYWGYIDGDFVSPMGSNHAHAESDQYVCLKDREGVEIYEGDIVSSDFYLPDFEEITSIEINSFSDDMGTEIGIFKSNEDAFRYGRLSVIGNIHQNPELLEV